ncbi:hypothetical protein F5Y16DRAFT_416717 [Xylariaceae sp. FL0255]|nr:hypothetical protein F5Y16DRAFT_416717 [Xylariaceae sp. FL0255]
MAINQKGERRVPATIRDALLGGQLPHRPKAQQHTAARRRAPRIWDLDIVKHNPHRLVSPERSPTASSCGSSFCLETPTDTSRSHSPESGGRSPAPASSFCSPPPDSPLRRSLPLLSPKRVKTEPNEAQSLFQSQARIKNLRESDDKDTDNHEFTPKRHHKLPGLHNILRTLHPDDFDRSINSFGTFRTPSTSPELNNNYTFSRRSSQATSEGVSRRSSQVAPEDIPRQPRLFSLADPIVAKLNSLRNEGNGCKEPLPPLSLPPFEDLLEACQEVMPDVSERQPVGEQYALRCATNAFQTEHNSRPRRAQSSRQSSPGGKLRKGRERPHNNIKYTTEEVDFIRFWRHDMGLHWPQVLEIFHQKFPMEDRDYDRRVTGLQGVLYRHNNVLPKVRSDRNELIMQENGHVDWVIVKCREQYSQRQFYSLIYLYPERAMTYPWLSAQYRQKAAAMNEVRQAQRNRARLQALESGKYVEVVKQCGCCIKKDRERDSKKRAKPRMTAEEIQRTYGHANKR